MDLNHINKSGNYNRSFALGVIFNDAFIMVEAGYRMAADSLALIADANCDLCFCPGS